MNISGSTELSPQGYGSSHLPEVLQDVIKNDLLGLVGVYSGEWIHVDDRIFKANQRKPQSAF